MRLLVLVALSASASLTAGCVAPWDQYDETSYVTIKDPGAAAYERHLAQLEKMTAVEPPPPGLCAEAGYYLVLLGRPHDAAAQFDREVAYYPASSSFVKMLRILVLDENVHAADHLDQGERSDDGSEATHGVGAEGAE